jgi:hypothetical protein
VINSLPRSLLVKFRNEFPTEISWCETTRMLEYLDAYGLNSLGDGYIMIIVLDDDIDIELVQREVLVDGEPLEQLKGQRAVSLIKRSDHHAYVLMSDGRQYVLLIHYSKVEINEIIHRADVIEDTLKLAREALGHVYRWRRSVEPTPPIPVLNNDLGVAVDQDRICYLADYQGSGICVCGMLVNGAVEAVVPSTIQSRIAEFDLPLLSLDVRHTIAGMSRNERMQYMQP